MAPEPAKLLTIGGSDSGGAAGVQADLKTWTALRVYGMSALTAVTAQNSVSVDGVEWLSSRFLMAQLDAVLADYGADAAKTGFLGRPDLIVAASAKLQTYRVRHVVIDPVLVNHRGVPMFSHAVTLAYQSYLLPPATLLTPNRHEAALLAGSSLPEPTELGRIRGLARRLRQFGPQAVLVKGGRDGEERVDVFYDGRSCHDLRIPHIDTINTHGAGDTLSAAAAAFLALGDGVETAVRRAHAFTHHAIARAAGWQLGAGHGPVSQV